MTINIFSDAFWAIPNWRGRLLFAVLLISCQFALGFS